MFGDRYTLRINLHHRWGAGFFRRRKGGRAREGPRRCKPGRCRRWSNCWYWGSTSWCVWDRNERSLCQSSAILTIRVQYWPFECNIVFMRNYIHWNTIMTVNAIFIFHHPDQADAADDQIVEIGARHLDVSVTENDRPLWCQSSAIFTIRMQYVFMWTYIHSNAIFFTSSAICVSVDWHHSSPCNMHRPVQCVFTRNLVHSNAIFIIQVQYFCMCMELHL